MFKQYVDYLRDNPEHYWFKAKWFGWGWVPATLEGWLATAVYLILVLTFGLTIDKLSPGREIAFTFVLPLVFLTTTFLAIVIKKGEKPHWRWGSPKK